MRLFSLVSLGLALAAPARSAAAQANPDRAPCESPSKAAALSERVASCTRLIESGEFHGADLAVLRYNRGLAYRVSKKYVEAIADLTQAIAIGGPEPDAFYNRGVAYEYSGDFVRAVADYSEAIRLKPDFANAFFKRGNAHAEQNQFSDAVADYTEALRLDPKDEIGILLNRGRAYRREKDFTHAIADFDRVLSLRPADPIVFLNRGVTFFDDSNYERAIADLDRAIEIHPKDPDGLYPMALFLRGLAKQKLGKSDAQADIAAAEAIWPEVVKEWDNLRSH